MYELSVLSFCSWKSTFPCISSRANLVKGHQGIQKVLQFKIKYIIVQTKLDQKGFYAAVTL